MIRVSTLAMLTILGNLAWAGEKYTKEQLQARFYYDLGPSTLDVSSYPKKQQVDYETFKRTCTQCHTLARPINSPIVGRNDWKRYVQRMHLHTQMRPGTSIGKAEAVAIVNFLTYDSERRKVEHKTEFEAKTQELQKLFNDVKAERSRLQIEEDRKKAKSLPPDGAGPPRP